MTKVFSLSEKEPVGLLGVGLVGGSLAGRLRGAGYPVYAYDPAPEAGTRIREIGAQSLGSEQQVGRQCRRLVLSLPGINEVRAVIALLCETSQPGDIIIDTTTSDPESVETIAEILKARGVAYLDATLGGSSRQIAAGEAIVMCGATDSAFHAAGDLLQNFSQSVFHTGPPGSGTRMKLVFNLVLGLQRAVLAEGLEFARSSGIDPQRALEILKAGPAHSRVMDSKGAKMIAGEFEPEARLAQHWKDVRLMLASAEANGATLPLTKAHEELLTRACASGWGQQDNSAIIRVFQEKNKCPR